MSDENTARLALPLLQPGQAQKEMWHNEALTLLDLLVQPVVLAVGLDTPPTAPEAGDAWVVGAAPSGAWSGSAGHIAAWSAGGWRFAAPIEGMAVWSVADGAGARYAAGGWAVGMLHGTTLVLGGHAVVGGRRGAIADATGGAVIDVEARGAIAAILAVLRGHGLIES